MAEQRRIELLSPAKNASIAKEAILHGADAVYIGAPKYGARSAAGNTVEDIASLVEYAHQYKAKIYVTLNTIIKDEELEEVTEMIHHLYKAGVDALIIQDMGIFRLDIPPIPLHASTQCDNTTPEKVRFLQEIGCTQVVLARELTINQIKDIAENTSVPLEVFVHGSLCVSYSGRCYLSRALSGRSANRGECAQCCRLPYDLSDADGQILIQGKHLLSLKDMNRGTYIEQLLDAGVTSFKIEGRLKDAEYVKNTTTYYRHILDDILSRRPEYVRSSSGKSVVTFIPDPIKSFNRGFIPYFSDEASFSNIASVDTPKSVGEEIGRIETISDRFIVADTEKELHNGDGLCYMSSDGNFSGFRINRTEGKKIYPADMPKLEKGYLLRRNYDIEFEKQLSVATAERKIAVDIELTCHGNKLKIKLTDEDNIEASSEYTLPSVEESRTPQEENQRRQLSKLGGTPYTLNSIILVGTQKLFITASQLNALRREVVENLTAVRLSSYKAEVSPARKTAVFPNDKLTYEANILNHKAVEFYRACGVKELQPAYEESPQPNVPLMTTRYCIKREFGQCPKQHPSKPWREPLYLQNGNTNLRLEFNCSKCLMSVVK
ncbi:MAG: U32 family peptidase [Bacteroidales bacterium]